MLFESRSLGTLATQLGEGEDVARARLERARTALFAAREQREKPFRDEKMLASWSGLAIGAFAQAGGALGDDALVAIAREGLAFVTRTLVREDGSLLHVAKGGSAKVDAFVDDYAELACAALDVYEASFDADALGLARKLAEAAIERFYDADAPSFFFAPPGRSDLVVRVKDSHDGPVPSGTSSLCQALLRLAAITGEERLADVARAVLGSMAARAIEHPAGFGHLLGALNRDAHGATEVVIVGRADDAAARALATVARRAYAPSLVLALVAPDAPSAERGAGAALEGRRQEGGVATAYVCRGRTCSAPVTSPDALRALLETDRPAAR